VIKQKCGNNKIIPSAYLWWTRGIIAEKGTKQASNSLNSLYTVKLFVKSPSLSPPILFAVTPYPRFEWYPQSKEILLNLSMKCWNWAFNAQGWRVIIIVVQVGAVKTYVALVKALREKERRDETQFTTKISGKTSLSPSYFVL